jgi:type III pantothenate kinase
MVEGSVPMLLAIDVGNTNVVFALVQGNEIRHRWRISTEHGRTADEYAVWLTQLMQIETIDRSAVEGAIISTVVPPALFDLRRLCSRYFGVEPLVIGEPGVDPGVRLAVPNPQEVGADRIVNSAAAHALYEGDLIVVDFGTATTFDVVVDGAYVGGAIAPGINLSMEALYMAAAKLPRIAIDAPPGGRATAQGTVPAMQSGVFFGYVGLVEGLVGRIKSEHGGPMTVVGTGGLANLFLPHTAAIDRVDGDLTIRGLALIHARNT